MTITEFGKLVNEQLLRLEENPFFLLESQFNSRSNNIEHTLYYYPNTEKNAKKDFTYRAKGYESTSQLLISLTVSIDEFLADTKEDIIIQ